jgi:GT2 family glycosyltransferase
MPESAKSLGSRSIGLVVIGRNEGDRLARCLASVRTIPNRVYVDSGSTDGSVALARTEGALVVQLPVPPHFTAARARNAGLALLLGNDPDLEYVQVVDGDCEVQPGWVDAALSVLSQDPNLALVFGRLRERFPERSVYNAIYDDEWNVPVGEATSCGGIVLFRVAALRQVGFYNPSIIAGEDSELAIRLRKAGWRLRSIEVEMALHDAAVTRFGQWWTRTRRTGHCFAELAFLHPDDADRDWSHPVRSALFWGGFMPFLLLTAILLALILDSRFWIAAALIFLPWPLKIWSLSRRQRLRGLSAKIANVSGALLMIGKLPQLLGAINYHWNRLTGRASRLIEYKHAES